MPWMATNRVLEKPPYIHQEIVFTKSFHLIHAQPDGLIVLSIHLLPLYLESIHGGNSLSSDTQTSLTPVTSSSGRTPRRSQARRSPSCLSWVFLEGLLKVGLAWNTSLGSCPGGNWNWATSAGLIWRSSSSTISSPQVTEHLTLPLTVQPATSRWKLNTASVFATSMSLPKACDQWWGQESTSK